MSGPDASVQMLVRPRVAPGPGAARHPLAFRSGIELLGLLIAARGHWQPLSRKQRAALRRAYLAAVAALPPEVPTDGVLVDLPELPDDVHPATARSLERRHLAYAGRISVLGVQVVQLADRDERPVVTAHVAGGQL